MSFGVGEIIIDNEKKPYFVRITSFGRRSGRKLWGRTRIEICVLLTLGVPEASEICAVF